MKVQASLDGEETVVGELEDSFLHYVHRNLPYNIWKTFSPQQKDGLKEHIKTVSYKHGKIKLLSNQEVKPSLCRIAVPPSRETSDEEDISLLIKLSPSEFERVCKISPSRITNTCPITQTNGFLDVEVTEEMFKLPKDHWNSLKLESKVKLCYKIR